MSNARTPSTTQEPVEFTVDELAARAQMTVRNVRAYASRGLMDAPRLEGRTGYYSLQHLQRLQLIRQLLD
ncbi:MAG: MerR family transcriptional regulator, partial [Aeromicrobium sp.]|uniref:MerR family transcriptional regulator n=1 Tax=Aeromicrobium sp. TaxID=1871063 RepID=UPI003C3EC500